MITAPGADVYAKSSLHIYASTVLMTRRNNIVYPGVFACYKIGENGKNV